MTTAARPSFLDSVEVNLQPAPFEIPDVDISEDRKDCALSLASLDLEPKAMSLCTCGKWFIPILEYKDHFGRSGRATCHLKMACENCGTGRAQAHRLFTVALERFRKITAEVTRTIEITISHTFSCNSPFEYRDRVQADKLKFSRIRKKYLMGGVISSVALDPEMKDVTFRVYHVGKIANKHWEKIGASCRIAWDNPVDALRWVLGGCEEIIKLSGPERAQWEAAFQGCRLTSSCGTLRGMELDEPEGDAVNAEAPYGYCPCGCGGVVTKATSHKSESALSLSVRYKILSFGPLKDYVPYSPKEQPPSTNWMIPEVLSSTSPPPW